MPYYYLIIFILLFTATAFLTWYLFRRTKSNSEKIFKTALQEENSGEFASAILHYETALNEAEKNGFDDHLRSLIIEKLKVLHTITTYEKDMQQQARVLQFDAIVQQPGSN